jgi:glc operon protein GlcG
MHQREVLGLAEAQAALEAALAEASKEPERPMAVAVVDDRGDLICFKRMDGALPLFTQMAISKAYTSSRMQRDTASFGNSQREKGREIAAWADDKKLTTVRGGLCIIKPGKGYLPAAGNISGMLLGGIGASGRSPQEDEEIALAGLEAIKFT